MQRAERVKYVCDDRVRESGVPTCGSCGALSRADGADAGRGFGGTLCARMDSRGRECERSVRE